MKPVSFLPAIFLFITCTILLSLPGNQLPKSNFFDIPFFDKYVHFGMFAMLAITFGIPFLHANKEVSYSLSWAFSILLYLIVYGIAMEFVQKYLVPNRSFDVVDILFDALGAFAGYAIIRRVLYKKIGSDGNRSRNQN